MRSFVKIEPSQNGKISLSFTDTDNTIRENKIVVKICEFTVYKLDNLKIQIQINEPFNPLLHNNAF